MEETEDWEQIPVLIRKAQDFVLEKSGKQIAQDIVEVEVYGPEMTDLTLIDLPGYAKVGDKVQTDSIVDEINILICNI